MFSWRDDASVSALGGNATRQVLELVARLGTSHQLLVAKADRMVAIF